MPSRGITWDRENGGGPAGIGLPSPALSRCIAAFRVMPCRPGLTGLTDGAHTAGPDGQLDPAAAAPPLTRLAAAVVHPRPGGNPDELDRDERHPRRRLG